MRTIRLFTPEISGNTAIFHWTMEPESTLYKRPSFRLEFDPALDLSRVSGRLWLDLMLLCLHQHWLLLRPCTVVLPAEITRAEQAFWLQLLKNASDTLHFSRNTNDVPPAELGIEIACAGPPLEHSVIDGSGVGTAFSSGKDSLLQAALLFELTDRPLLVTTTSPLPPLQDHETERRKDIFKAIQERRDSIFSEVVSDLRANWDNGFARQQGYRVSVNEISDTFLYMSSLLAVGAALGRTRLFLASEVEVQENVEHDGVIVQHSHFMYSAATQRALSAYLQPHGIKFGSLIWPLYSQQVQRLLWARYPDLADLQYSCWRVTRGRKTCSACEQCLRTAMTALAEGEDPERMGIDLERLMAYSPQWQPVPPAESPSWGPKIIAANRSRRLVAGMIKSTSVRQFGMALFKNRWSRRLSPPYWLALLRYRRLHSRVSPYAQPKKTGVRGLFFDWLDADLKGRLTAIYGEHFGLEPVEEYAAIFERSKALTERATSKLSLAHSGQSPAKPCEP